jgi:hypothetical protein
VDLRAGLDVVEKRNFLTLQGLKLQPFCPPARSQLYRLRYSDTYEITENQKTKKKQTPWSESTSEQYRPSDRRLSAKRLPTFEDRGCHVVSVTDPYGRILDFLDRSRYFSIKKIPSCTHEAEWTPFQTHYFFFLVVPGIEPGPPDL